VLGLVESLPEGIVRRASIGPAVEADAAALPADRLAAFVGRTP